MNSKEIVRVTELAIESVIKNLKDNRDNLLKDYQNAIIADNDYQIEAAKLLVGIEKRIKKVKKCLKYWIIALSRICECLEITISKMSFIDIDFETDSCIDAVNIIINYDHIINLEYDKSNEFDNMIYIKKKISDDAGYTFSESITSALFIDNDIDERNTLDNFIENIIKSIRNKAIPLSFKKEE